MWNVSYDSLCFGKQENSLKNKKKLETHPKKEPETRTDKFETWRDLDKEKLERITRFSGDVFSGVFKVFSKTKSTRRRWNPAEKWRHGWLVLKRGPLGHSPTKTSGFECLVFSFTFLKSQPNSN